MSTYLTRPVFPRPINWSESPQQSFSYDLSDRWVGQFRVADPVQSHTVRGFEFAILLENEDEIADYDEWSDDLRGRLDGFWIPSPFDAAEILSAYDASSFYIRSQLAEGTFGDHPGVHVVFSKPGQSDEYAMVDFILDERTGMEVVGLTGPLTTVVDSSWSIRPLLYVRFASDEEKAEFVADRLQRRQLRVIELPTEYAQIETGQQPVWLYRFWFDQPGAEWHFTSLDSQVTSNGDTYVPAPIDHQSHQRALKADRDTIDIESWHSTNNPLSRMVPFTLPRPLWVEVMRTTWSDLDAVTVVFSGKVATVETDGKRLKARCAAMLDVLRRRCPAMALQNRCNWFLFSTPCGVTKADWTASVTIEKLSGPYVDVSAPVDQGDIPNDTPENIFQYGWLETGSGQSFEVRQIVRSSSKSGDRVTLSLNAPLVFAEVGDAATIYTGCDGQASTCKTCYSNFPNWGGHVLVPSNLSVQAVESESDGGGKK